MDKRKPTQIADVGEQDDREHNDPEYTYTCLTHRYIDESKQGPRDYVWAGNCDFAWNTRTRRSTIDSAPTIHFSRWSFVGINSPKERDHISSPLFILEIRSIPFHALMFAFEFFFLFFFFSFSLFLCILLDSSLQEVLDSSPLIRSRYACLRSF